MSDPAFPDRWKIVGSTTRRLFPVGAGLRVVRPVPERFEVRILRQGKPEEELSSGDFPITAPEVEPTLKGDVPDGNGGTVQLVATLCLGDDKVPSFLCGHVTRAGQRIGDGATGVWVAEEDRPPKDPPGRN